MIQISAKAQKEVVALIAKNQDAVRGLRIVAHARSPFKVDYKLGLVAKDQVGSADAIVPFEGFEVYIDPDSAALLEGATMDYVRGLMGSGFNIERSRDSIAKREGPLAERILAVIDDQLNPSLASHGGRVCLVDIKEDVAYVELEGGCQGCAMSQVTLKQGIEKAIKEAVPEIAEVVDVTEHKDGQDPYYK